MRKAALPLIILAGMLVGCSTHQVPMTYNPASVTGKPMATTPDVELLGVTDSRKYTGTHLGAIRGGYGNALKTLEAPRPVAEVVRQAFADGLAARGLLSQANAGRYGLDVTVEKLDCSQLVRREAHARFRVSVLDKTSGRPVLAKTFEDNRTDEGTLAGGIFGSVEVLGKMANDSMQAAIDRALDDPTFLTVIGAR